MTIPRLPEKTFYGVFLEEAYADVYDTDIVYFITWAPNPARYPTNTPSDQYKVLLDLVLFNTYKVFKTFAFTPELSQQGNIHVHGFYVIKDIVKYYKWFLPKIKTFGIVKITRVKRKYADHVLSYLSKDIEMMNRILEDKLPIPLTHKNEVLYRRMFRLTKKKLRLIPNSKSYSKVFKPRVMDITKLLKDQEDEVESDNNSDYKLN